MLNEDTRALFDFIKSSPTAYHAVRTVKERLISQDFEELTPETVLADGKGYYALRNDSSIIAFRYKSNAAGYMIAASHSDSPAFKVKVTPETVGAYTRLEVEKYGGMIFYSWLDRPLSVAGRVLVSVDGGIESRLVDFGRDLVSIPSVAIHLNRGVNTEGAKLNPAVDMLPLYSSDKEKGDFLSELAGLAGAAPEDIVSHDLFVYSREDGRVFGKNDEFILAPRLDDLGCVYASLAAFSDAQCSDSIPVLAVFDNEEVGSSTKQGAASTFLYDTLSSVSGTRDRYQAMLEHSFMVSADNAHAVHPAHPELSDTDNAPRLGGGIVIKYNAAQSYATDGLSDAVFRTLCRRADVSVQSYYNRADLPGGSTLGSIADTKVSVPTVDIGLPQLAMHSASETSAQSDLSDMIRALRELFSSSILKDSGKIAFK